MLFRECVHTCVSVSLLSTCVCACVCACVCVCVCVCVMSVSLLSTVEPLYKGHTGLGYSHDFCVVEKCSSSIVLTGLTLSTLT